MVATPNFITKLLMIKCSRNRIVDRCTPYRIEILTLCSYLLLFLSRIVFHWKNKCFHCSQKHYTNNWHRLKWYCVYIGIKVSLSRGSTESELNVRIWRNRNLRSKHFFKRFKFLSRRLKNRQNSKAFFREGTSNTMNISGKIFEFYAK